MLTDSYPEGDPQLGTAPVVIDPCEQTGLDPDFEIEVGGGPVDAGDPIQTNPPPR